MISDQLLENMIRHAELKRDAALDGSRESFPEDVEFREFAGIEASFWTDMFEALIELQYTRATKSSDRVARCERLEAALTKLIAEFDDLDEHRPLHVGCIQCTEGATPDRYNTGPCAYHAARVVLEGKT